VLSTLAPGSINGRFRLRDRVAFGLDRPPLPRAGLEVAPIICLN
jgi:hypothetical protein